MGKKAIISGACLLWGTIVWGAEPSTSPPNHHHDTTINTPLTEPGNDAFGTIQEVIEQLNADPNTDWSQVNLEALRQHLIDMREMTLNVDIVSRTPIDHGLRTVIRPTTKRAQEALQRVLQAHPAQLKRESGWTMSVKPLNQDIELTITGSRPEDTDKIRGLGYIGLMAYGRHHQAHHWVIARGINPHQGHMHQH